MSTYTIPWESEASALDLWAALVAAGLAPTGLELGPGTVSVSFAADLTPTQQAAARDIAKDILDARHTGVVTLTLAEYQVIKPDIAGLRSYLALPSPTAAQTAAAVKAIIRVLGTLGRS